MKLHSRLSYLPTALAGIIICALWQAIVVSSGVSVSARWGIVLTLAVGAVIGIGALVLKNRGELLPAATAVAAPVRVAAAPMRAAGWRFDGAARTVIDPVVEPLVAQMPSSLARALVGVFEDPLTNPRDVMNGEIVYIQRVNASTSEREETERPPSLLLGYAAVQREGAIRILGVDRVAESSAPVVDDEALEALQRMDAIARARSGGGHAPVTEH